MNGRTLGAIPALLLAISFGLCCAAATAADDGAAARGASAAQRAGRFLITGSRTMAPLVSEIAERFRALHPEVQIEVRPSDSGHGISDVMQGKADIGMVSRALHDKETILYSFAIGRDGICLVVHKSNPVSELTNRQVADIYAGKIGNWAKVGGGDAAITVVTPRQGYGAVDLFTQFFSIKYADIKAQVVVGDSAERVNAILANPNGIAYASVGQAERKVKTGAPIKLLPVDGVAPTRKNIRKGEFPLSRPLLLLTKNLPAGRVKEFIDFSLSSQVTDLIDKYDFVPYLD